MNDPMTILKADHRDVRRMLTSLAESEEGPEREQMVTELDQALTVHMQLEEQLVYPLVQRNVGAEDAEEAEIEHGFARETLQKLVSMTSEPGFGALVEMLRGGIEHHVKEEESEILPELKDALSRDEWLAIGDQIVEAKQAAGMPMPAPKSTAKRSSKRQPKAKAGSKR